MRVEGSWYPARSSARRPATIDLFSDHYRLMTAEVHTASEAAVASSAMTFAETAKGSIDMLTISNRVGSTSRRIHFTDGSQFETPDNDSLDAWARGQRHIPGSSLLLHSLESKWKMVVIGVAVTFLTVFSSLKWGLPAAATHIANAMPVSAHEFIGQGTLSAMDRWILEPSELDTNEQRDIQRRFENLLASGPTEGFNFTLHFRGMHDIPNAFALPAGDIVLTDSLVELAETDDEIDAILLHEIGHVIHKHSMRHVIEASTLAMTVSLAVGDVGALGQLATGVPVFLLQNSYSRHSESEADEFAFARMLTLDKDPKHFAAIMRRLETAVSGDREDKPGTDSNETTSDWYSTHPNSEARAQRAMEVSRSLTQDL